MKMPEDEIVHFQREIFTALIFFAAEEGREKLPLDGKTALRAFQSSIVASYGYNPVYAGKRSLSRWGLYLLEKRSSPWGDDFKEVLSGLIQEQTKERDCWFNIFLRGVKAGVKTKGSRDSTKKNHVFLHPDFISDARVVISSLADETLKHCRDIARLMADYLKQYSIEPGEKTATDSPDAEGLLL